MRAPYKREYAETLERHDLRPFTAMAMGLGEPLRTRRRLLARRGNGSAQAAEPSQAAAALYVTPSMRPGTR